MAKFRKKPVEIEAWQFDAPTFIPQPNWFVQAMDAGKIYYQGGESPYYTIRTIQGRMRARPGDWIIRGAMGEIYTCDPEAFAATYEPA